MQAGDGFAHAVPPPAGARVLAAVSGGPDSTALLRWLAELGTPVVAAYFDHALREGSERDGEYVAGVCARLQVPLIRGRRARPLTPGSVQAAARELRYEFLERSRRRAGCELIATAHTADDVVEGVLLHLLRGSGVAGLRGMPERRDVVVRPFLRVWRQEIERWLAALGEHPCQDPSNLSVDRFARARVRGLLLPALERDRPGIAARVRRVAGLAAGWQAALEAEAKLVGDERARLGQAPPPVRAEAYRQLFGDQPALSRRHLRALDRLLLVGRTGDGIDLPGGRRARLEPMRLAIVPAETSRRPLPSLSVRRCPGCEDAAAVHLRPGLDPETLHVDRRRPGLRLRLSAGSRKLQDVLTDAKVPRHERDDLPLVFAGDRLAWVPGVAVDHELQVPTAQPGVHLGLAYVWKKEGMVVSASPTTRRPHS